jgi:pimeloyl-ACP methyl ester carboxylesterase
MSSTASDPASVETVLLIHGMWMTPLSWEHWASRYTGQGHNVIAPAWPGLEAEPEQLRRDPSPLRNLSITDVVDNYDKIIRGLDRPPIIIGHSFGGLFTQLLADRGLGTAAVTLGTGAPKGVLRLPLSTLRAAWPALGNPRNLKKETPLTPKQFHWCFTNALSREDSDAVYERYYIPGSARPFFQAGSANFNPKAVTKVDYRNASRPPMLLVTGTEDRICPPSVNKANFKKQRQAPSATEHKEYPGRCHFPGQDGWEEVADFVLAWAAEHSNRTAQAG